MEQTDQQRVDNPPGRGLPRRLRQFLATEASGGILLLAAAVVALVWANSPWGASYQALWHTDVALSFGRYALEGDLHHWVNDALMVVFFFVVGLEIKGELVHGKLRDPKTAAMPALAALGGMIVPALLFLLVSSGGGGSRGWGIPMATDIAFAVGVLALLGPRVPSSLKLFLLTLAIVDDIGAIVVIGLFYSSGLQPQFLVAAVGLVVLIVVLNQAGVVWLPVYVALTGALWLVTYTSGVHATIAGVILGLLTPANNPAPPAMAPESAGALHDEPTVEELEAMVRLHQHSVSPAERIGHLLHPWSSFAIVPVFALAMRASSSGPTPSTPRAPPPSPPQSWRAWWCGKTVGIAGAAWLAARTGIARLPEFATWPMLVGVAAVAGIGFTVSLFIAELAFEVGPLQDSAKLGVLAASAVAAALGGTVLRRACRPRVVQP